MNIIKYIPGSQIDMETVVALGQFDGVHAGHRLLLQTAKRAAEERGLVFCVFTFIAESRFKDSSLLYSNEEKLRLLEEIGADAVVLADFSDVSGICAEDFVRNCLFRDMGCRVAVAGFDFRFGRGALGDARLLSQMLNSLGAECIIEDEHKIGGEKISTTRVKELLSQGDVKTARSFLGIPYYLRCEVKHGRGVGRTLGFPTVNTAMGVAQLKHGVYRTAVDISGKLYTGVTNVGVCPTFDEREPHAETYIVGYDGDLYGESIRIFFLGYLREEKRFLNPNELKMQINVDKNNAITENGELTWQAIGLS